MKRANLLCSFFAVMVLMTAAVLSQTRFAMSPVPIWSADGIISPEYQDKYVFWDVESGEAVLAYPANLGTPGYETSPGDRVIRRFALSRNVEPELSVRVEAINPLKYRYHYTVKNGSDSRNPIKRWNIVLPRAALGDVARIPERPEGWVSLTSKAREYAMADAEAEWVHSGATASFSNMDDETRVSAGRKIAGFMLESQLKPGYTLAYFRSSNSPDRPNGDTLPLEVQKQLGLLMHIEFNSKSLSTLGPKFASDTHEYTIVRDFRSAVTHFIRSGMLDADSPFVTDLMRSFNGYIQTYRSAGVELHEFVGPRIAVYIEPETALEVEIAAAVALSLGP